MYGQKEKVLQLQLISVVFWTDSAYAAGTWIAWSSLIFGFGQTCMLNRGLAANALSRYFGSAQVEAGRAGTLESTQVRISCQIGNRKDCLSVL